MTLEKALNYASFIFAATIVFLALAFTYVMVVPIDILDEWKISMDKEIYTTGQPATVTISFNKLRDARSSTFYYIECQRPTGGYLRYPLNQAKGDRPAGAGKVEQYMTIPTDIANLPAKCRYSVTSTYTVYKYRHVVEENHTALFTVEKKDKP